MHSPFFRLFNENWIFTRLNHFFILLCGNLFEVDEENGNLISNFEKMMMLLGLTQVACLFFSICSSWIPAILGVAVFGCSAGFGPNWVCWFGVFCCIEGWFLEFFNVYRKWFKVFLLLKMGNYLMLFLIGNYLMPLALNKQNHWVFFTKFKLKNACFLRTH